VIGTIIWIVLFIIERILTFFEHRLFGKARKLTQKDVQEKASWNQFIQKTVQFRGSTLFFVAVSPYTPTDFLAIGISFVGACSLGSLHVFKWRSKPGKYFYFSRKLGCWRPFCDWTHFLHWYFFFWFK
jgi:hypothetical protein